MSGFTKVNLMEIESSASEDGPVSESRFARQPLGSDHVGVSHFRYKAGRRSERGHSHREQEEVYLVLSGSGRLKLDDEIVEVKPWDLIRVGPETRRGFEGGPDGLELLAVANDRPEGGDGVAGTDDNWWGD